MDNENWPNALLGPRESTNLIFSGISWLVKKNCSFSKLFSN
jgi:hypothetical protein